MAESRATTHVDRALSLLLPLLFLGLLVGLGSYVIWLRVTTGEGPGGHLGSEPPAPCPQWEVTTLELADPGSDALPQVRALLSLRPDGLRTLIPGVPQALAPGWEPVAVTDNQWSSTIYLRRCRTTEGAQP